MEAVSKLADRQFERAADEKPTFGTNRVLAERLWRFCVHHGAGSVAPDLRVMTWALCIDPPFYQIDSG
jgi:hypothetical protein